MSDGYGHGPVFITKRDNPTDKDFEELIESATQELEYGTRSMSVDNRIIKNLIRALEDLLKIKKSQDAELKELKSQLDWSADDT